MVNPSKIKGTRAETAFVTWLQRYFPYAERRSLRGGKDCGDVTGIPGLVFEVKDANPWQLSAWLRETEVERRNANAEFGLLVVKPPGVGYTRVSQWAVVVYQKDPIEVVNTGLESDFFQSVLVASGNKVNEVRRGWVRNPHDQLTVIQAKASETSDWYCLMTAQAMLGVLVRRGYLDEDRLLDTLLPQ